MGTTLRYGMRVKFTENIPNKFYAGCMGYVVGKDDDGKAIVLIDKPSPDVSDKYQIKVSISDRSHVNTRCQYVDGNYIWFD